MSGLRLFQLPDGALDIEYVDALAGPLKNFLLGKGAGHCQRSITSLDW
jgi:hypothetical protein